jgi:hypothetical protein
VIGDPTHPTRWPAQQVRGREVFALQYGVLALGLPLSVVLDVIVLVVRRDAALFFSAHHAIQLLLMTTTVGLVAGLLLGRTLWRIGERRYGDVLLTREFGGADSSGSDSRQCCHPERSEGSTPCD